MHIHVLFYFNLEIQALKVHDSFFVFRNDSWVSFSGYNEVFLTEVEKYAELVGGKYTVVCWLHFIRFAAYVLFALVFSLANGSVPEDKEEVAGSEDSQEIESGVF